VTVPTTIDAWRLAKQVPRGADGDTDLARAMLAAFAEAMMSAQASMQCNAGYGERTDERENSRNGYRMRPWDTRVGTIDLAVPKLRQGVYSPEFLLQPRRRAEQALVAVVCQAYVEGVSTRRVDDLVKAMGIDGISKSEVSRLAAELDAVVAEFRSVPWTPGPYRYLWIDAVTQRVREGGRVVNVSAVIATASNAEGRREIVGFDIVTTEDTAAWTAFCARSWPGGCRGWSSSSPTPTAASRPPSPPCLAEPPGSGAEPISWPTWRHGSPRPRGP
jgi:putative transposase